MRLKIIVITTALISILLLVVFGAALRERAVSKLVSDVPEYNCDNTTLCTSCILNGDLCECGPHTCDCGNRTIDKEECSLF